MSEILFYSIARAGGVTLPPDLTDPASPSYRPLYAPRRKRRARGSGALRRWAGRRLVGLGNLALRLGRRWAGPLEQTAPLPRLTAVK